MKIAFDATVLHGRKSGVGYYCEELLKAMVLQDRDTEVFVFSHQPVQLDLGSARNVRFSDSRFCPVRAFYLHLLLPAILRREKPDLCHYTNFLAPIVDGTPYVVTIHDMGLERLRSAHPIAKRLYTRPLVPRIAQRARLVVTNSEFSKWEIVRYLGIPDSRIRVTPLAASSEFHPVSRAERAAILHQYGLAAPYLLYVGNLEPRKNLGRLLQALAAFRDKDHELAIVGNPWYRGSEAEAAARRLGIAERVRFLGYVPREHLPSLYSGATVFVYPSLLEGFGLPVIEAMACGTPVVTSDNSSLREIAGDAALLIDPLSVRSIQEGLTDVLEDPGLRTTLALRGLARAKQYSWEATAELTLQAYEDAMCAGRRSPLLERGGVARRAGVVSNKEPSSQSVSLMDTTPSASAFGLASTPPRPRRGPALADAIQQTIDYCAMFQYPLRRDELRERLFDVEVDQAGLDHACKMLGLPQIKEFIAVDPEFVSTRALREDLSDRAIREVWPHLQTLASMPFVRMIAFSGATAHRNMTNSQDVDLFMVVEDGKLWSTFLMAMVWAKMRGLRGRLCMNYVISDRALPLFDHDVFTAQQVASLKPIYGKAVYDRFLNSNAFVRERFPNFNPQLHRASYPEIHVSATRKAVERLLALGPVQVFERMSRGVLGLYLRRKASAMSAGGEGDVLLEPRRLKLHMKSHKNEVLSGRAAGSLAPTMEKR